MSTYLVALVVSDYGKIQDVTKTGIALSVYAPPHMTGQAQFALNVAVKLFDYFQSFFGVPYPLPKLDLISMPDFAAGMPFSIFPKFVLQTINFTLFFLKVQWRTGAWPCSARAPC